MHRVAYRGITDEPVVEPVRAPTIFATEIAASMVDDHGIVHLLLVNEVVRCDGRPERRVVLRLQMPLDLEGTAGKAIARAYANTAAAKRKRLV